MLFLRHHANRAWTPSDIATELRATGSAIEMRLDDLMARGLAQKIPDGTYRYASSERFENTVKELADVYRSRRTSVIQTIFSGPSDAVRSFADAFKLGQEEEDDG